MQTTYNPALLAQLHHERGERQRRLIRPGRRVAAAVEERRARRAAAGLERQHR